MQDKVLIYSITTMIGSMYYHRHFIYLLTFQKELHPLLLNNLITTAIKPYTILTKSTKKLQFH